MEKREAGAEEEQEGAGGFGGVAEAELDGLAAEGTDGVVVGVGPGGAGAAAVAEVLGGGGGGEVLNGVGGGGGGGAVLPAGEVGRG